ncbi:chromosome partitioning protein, ParB family [Cognatiyoonia koreensis]|uniref:Chromosome partitioning protein, ParB family n=1 Tax=Cognatiyoonia koreensis TaxID=364200 RepID=A0A1I0RPH4_9RHOB|nr:ParB/RepB/Spo0J family partition protein [Cognatiyoonia koreensis]SEW43126.1 chromosome partitioning protein, ParB family [Cognatiyoonia koreensis]
MATSKSRGLGRGLSALMADVNADVPQDNATPRRPDAKMPIERVVPNPDQPRRSFDQDALSDLAASIREKGIIQPIIVREDPRNADLYQIVAGERRWRAAQIANLHEVPVLIRSFDDTEVLEVAIIENIQRADLNPVDEAAGYRHLMERFGHTQDQLSKVLGKSRSHVANQMRLLSLPQDVLDFLARGDLSAGHARALIGHDDASQLARQVIQKNLSVRDTEKLVKQGLKPKTSKPAEKQSKDADTLQIEGELAAQIGMSVTIDHKPNSEGGTLSIRYKSLEQLDDLLRLLSGS